MNSVLKFKRSSLLIFLIISLFLFLIQCINNGADKRKTINSKNDSYQQYTGSKACAMCHRNVYDSFINAGHFTSSQIVDFKNIKGSFEKGKKPGVVLLTTANGPWQSSRVF